MRFYRIFFVASFLLGVFSFGYVGAQAQQPQNNPKEPEKIPDGKIFVSMAQIDAAAKLGLIDDKRAASIKAEMANWKNMDDVKNAKQKLVNGTEVPFVEFWKDEIDKKMQ